MRIATHKHLSVVRGIARFAQVTVGQLEPLDIGSPPEPQLFLNDHPLPSLSDAEREVIDAARRGIREAEVGLEWQGPEHFVVKIEGLEVDGIDAGAACLAAGEATKELIEK